MADPRFFTRRGPFSLEFLASAVGGVLDTAADPELAIADVVPLEPVGAGCIVDNLVQIAHNVVPGKGCIIVAQVGIAGSSILEDHVVVGGQAGLSDHVRPGRGAKVAAQGGVMRDIDPGVEVGGAPAVPIRQWHRQTLALARLATRKGD
jgi:UDP-3-O-[3-hydroxymyristoyl] glucosamine N-acyltransferase